MVCKHISKVVYLVTIFADDNKLGGVANHLALRARLLNQ